MGIPNLPADAAAQAGNEQGTGNFEGTRNGVDGNVIFGAVMICHKSEMREIVTGYQFPDWFISETPINTNRLISR